MMKVFVFLLCMMPVLLYAGSINDLQSGFLNPPNCAKPYVWWHWMGSNFSKEGITKDLEAMKEEGVGGATIFNISSAVQETHSPTENNPWPQQTYRSAEYWDALIWAAKEAERLGLELGIHNTAGYSTTGGPWIDEKRGMKRIIMSSTIINNNSDIYLPVPELKPYNGWGSSNRIPSIYTDIAVLAIPINGECVNIGNILNLTKYMDKNGYLDYKFTKGEWKVFRIGYASTMSNPHPLPDELIGNSFEVDKITSSNTRFHWNNVLSPIVKKLGKYIGRSFNHILIDSYEAGEQNWSENFRQEFLKRKGYDPIPWLITDQHIINDKQQTMRFKWDYQDVISDLYYTNGWKIAQQMIHKSGLTLYQEPYYGPFNIVDGTVLSDVPMGEFWTNGNGRILSEIPAAAHAFNKKIIGAEAFTGTPELSAWTEDPAFLKLFAEGAFTSGVNRLILHHWVHQPFDDRYQPGMSMGWWGTHFSRHQTWFEPAKAFFTYLSRTQYMLQYGDPVSDYLCLEKQVGRPSDVISVRLFLQDNIIVKDRQIILSSGRKYAFLVLPDSKTMLPEVLDRIYDLVNKGVIIVLKELPQASPSLKDYPSCDSYVKNRSLDLYNKYRDQIFYNIEDAKNYCNLSSDFSINNSSLRDSIGYVHRCTDSEDIYYIANLTKSEQNFLASLRIDDKLPEVWNAEDASIKVAQNWKISNGHTDVELNLRPMQSVFVVFNKKATKEQIEEGYVIKKKYMLDKTIPLDNYWNIYFRPKLGKPFMRYFDCLSDWSLHPDEEIAYFSGSATYTKSVHIIKEDLINKRIELDLGELHDIAELKINGEEVGVLWYPPYVKDITSWLKPGENTIEVIVTNNWANALIGDEQKSADFEWGDDRGQKGRAIKKYPDWFLEGKQRPSSRKYFTVWYYHRKDSQLQKAGLLGPVRIKEYIENN